MSGREPIFVASMMVASSSAMIGKMLHDSGLLHERSGNLAMSISVLEDIVAVIVLTFVSSLANMQAGPQARPAAILGTLIAFVTIVVILGLLLLPKVLQLLAKAGLDLVMLFITGLALEVGIIAVRTGYSLALGAFLLGAIIAETPQRPAIERAFEGMRDVFLAVFFVSIGLLIDPWALLKNWWLIVCLGIGAVVIRSFAVTTGLILAGNPQREALRAGLMAIPIGEFAFIIAQVGVSSGLLAPDFYPIAIGVATFTATVAPILSRHSDEITKRLLTLEPPFITNLVAGYQQFLAEAAEKQRRSEIISHPCFDASRNGNPSFRLALDFGSRPAIDFLVLRICSDDWNPFGSDFPAEISPPARADRQRIERGHSFSGRTTKKNSARVVKRL
jgi:CPA2 family monovalent cation:H+ antiporter-2